MYQYSVGLAAFDYVPIVLSGVGLYFVAATATAWSGRWQQLARLGAVLIICGGISKASWKLIVATAQIDISWMNTALFFCLAPGMLILAGAVWGASRNKGVGARLLTLAAPATLIFGAALIALNWPQQRYHTALLLMLTTIGNVALAGQLIVKSWHLKRPSASILFFCNIIAVFALAGLARIPAQTEPLQWLEEFINAFSQAAFAYAAYILYTAVNKKSLENNHYDINTK
ncbi:hypothetical protein [Zhongshania sp.]|jgi:hypothetical protein|uniref:hypothetical protein n=1 Tax=Zhongshania sp. TaxID=1971902 RepID=UPI002A802AB3|nr:hypothetical protein [Zhongshania sp.]